MNEIADRRVKADDPPDMEAGWEEFYAWVVSRARAEIDHLPEGFSIEHHPHAANGLVWKGIHPNGWQKARTRQEAEDWLYVLAFDRLLAIERSRSL